MFTTEQEWSAAYEAAHNEILLAMASGDIVANPKLVKTLAVKIATAAIRNALSVQEDDIANFPGVVVEKITIQRLPEKVAS